MLLAGVTWLLGTLLPATVSWHRGPLAHLALTYPNGRVHRPLAVAAMGARYLTAIVPAVAGPEGAGRATTALAVDGDTLAVLSHRPRLNEDHRLVAEVLSAARLPLDNERLAARARAQVVELTASQARIIESGDAERRRLERDLHDGAQQRLVALMLALRLARATASAADARLIESVVVDLREVVAAVRRVASGI